jgi:hypothetical protein
LARAADTPPLINAAPPTRAARREITGNIVHSFD